MISVRVFKYISFLSYSYGTHLREFLLLEYSASLMSHERYAVFIHCSLLF